MIFQTKNKKPFIHFGFNLQNKTVAVGDDVVIWQKELYNPNIYENNLVADGTPTTVSKTLNKVVITYASAGVYDIEIDTSNLPKTIVKKSNTITLTVV